MADRQAQSLTSAARLLVERINRGLAVQWRDHEALAALVARHGVGGHFPAILDASLALNDRLAWVGVAAPDGRVILGSHRVLEGADVSAQPWFRAGLAGRYAGDVHEAASLRRMLPPRPDGEPFRLIAYASPLRGPDGRLIGVLASHLDWNWIRDLVLGAPLPAGTEAILLAAHGQILAGPPGLDPQPLERLLAAATVEAPRYAEIAWADGRVYAAVALAVGGAADAPSFGWTLVLRQPLEGAFLLHATLRAVLGPLVLAALAILLIGLFLAQLLANRLRWLAEAALAMAEARLDRPVPQMRVVREMAILSEALARLDRHENAPAAIREHEEAR
ncbi:MAG: cache domain-containing protein [Rhodovarius sp.]|nr:cache domain-containing protein [Rhodovarius sp.]